MNRDAPVGIFDSGVGGLTVARAVLEHLPEESLRYVGDTAHSPYGPLPVEQVARHALAVADDLVEHGVKALVIACNTATAACLHEARERYPVPVVEVITPAVRRALATTRNGRVGVIATRGTVASGAYERAFAGSGVSVRTAACPRFVDFVERGLTNGRQVLGLAQAYLEPLQAADVDTVVLGCTHYPLLADVLQLVLGDGVTLVSSAQETALELGATLGERDLLRPAGGPPPVRELRATGDPEHFARLGRRFLGAGLPFVGHVTS